MNIVLSCGLTEKKLKRKILPLINNSNISNIFLIRSKPFIHDKIINFIPPFLSDNNAVLFLYRLVIIPYLIVKYKTKLLIGITFIPHGLPIGLISRFSKIKNIQMLIGSDYLQIKKSKLLQKLFFLTDLIIPRGSFTKKDILENFVFRADNIVPMPNSFEFVTLPKENIEYDLIYIGNFWREKRVDLLIQAIAKVSDKYQNIKVALVGDGYQQQELENLVASYNLKNNIHFLGNQQNVYHFILKSKIFIMTSEHEGMPMAMVEALSQGIPCILPNVSNIPEYAIHENNSLLVPPLDLNGFSEAIDLLMTDDELYKKLKAGAEKFREEHEYEFSLENITNIWNQIFMQLGLIKENNAQ